MGSGSKVRSEIKLVYEKAGVGFVVGIEPSDDGAAGLRIAVEDAAGGKSLTFDEECSPILGDFIGGFVRWLATIGITAKHEQGEVTGSFSAAYDAHKLIQASAAICDMIEQRFSLYPYSILA